LSPEIATVTNPTSSHNLNLQALADILRPGREEWRDSAIVGVFGVIRPDVVWLVLLVPG